MLRVRSRPRARRRGATGRLGGSRDAKPVSGRRPAASSLELGHVRLEKPCLPRNFFWLAKRESIPRRAEAARRFASRERIGASVLSNNILVEAGNPADSARLLPMLERHIAFYGEAPRQAAGQPEELDWADALSQPDFEWVAIGEASMMEIGDAVGITLRSENPD